MSTAPLTDRPRVQNTLAWLLAALYCVLVLVSFPGCVPFTAYDVPGAPRREIHQHHRRAQQARHHRVRQRPLPRPNPEWRQRY